MYGFPYSNMYIGQVQKVKGNEGAKDFPMGPNSSVFVLDENGEIVWLLIPDEIGRKTTVKPFKLEDYVVAPAPDINSVMQRINDLENKLGGLIHELTGDTSVTDK